MTTEGSYTVFGVSTVAGNGLEGRDNSIPLMIPADEAYLWTKEWMEGDREAREDYEQGNYVVILPDDSVDVMRQKLLGGLPGDD